MRECQIDSKAGKQHYESSKAWFAYQHVYECLHALEHFQYQQGQMQWDLKVGLNHQKGNLFEEEKAADNLGLGNTATGWYRNFIVRN